MFVRNVLRGGRALGDTLSIGARSAAAQHSRSMAYYPIDESIFGLTEEQQQVSSLYIRDAQ